MRAWIFLAAVAGLLMLCVNAMPVRHSGEYEMSGDGEDDSPHMVYMPWPDPVASGADESFYYSKEEGVITWNSGMFNY